MCERHLGDAPDVTIHGPVGFTFAYLPSHLHHMLFELLKNSMRAVVEHHGDGDDGDGDGDAELPPIRVIISAGRDLEDVVIKVSDEGGGINRAGLERMWGYFYTTSTAAFEAEDGGDMGGDFTTDTPLAGLGYGLPLSRVYARYYGGDLKVISMEGYGTDAFLYLSSAGTVKEHVQAAAEASANAFKKRERLM